MSKQRLGHERKRGAGPHKDRKKESRKRPLDELAEALANYEEQEGRKEHEEDEEGAEEADAGSSEASRQRPSGPQNGDTTD